MQMSPVATPQQENGRIAPARAIDAKKKCT